MINAIVGASDYSQQAYNTAHFTVAVQKIYSVIVEGNCNV
jgi:hypothetical protein